MSKIIFGAPIPHSVLLTGPVMVTSNGTIYTQSWILNRKQFFGVEVKFTSDTDVNVQVDFEQSNYPPEVQGSYSSNFVTAIDSLGTVTDEEPHLFPIAPIVSVYGRLKLTGLYSGTASNSITTVLDRANWVEVEA